MIEAQANHGRSGRGVKLSGIFPGARFIGCDDIVARGCKDAAARCGRGDVFVARLTERDDGHEQVALAVARGATGVIAERMVPTAGAPLCLVRHSDWAFARLTQALAGDPAAAMRVIAVTGSSGKTTTSWLAASVLAEAGLAVGVLSDLGCIGPDGTTPERWDHSRPEVLASWLARLAADGCSHAVIEVSSRMLAAQALAGIACDTVAVTNIVRPHAKPHGTHGGYRWGKSHIRSRILGSLAAHGCLVADGDGRLDRLLERAARAVPGATCLTSGFAAACDLRARVIERSLSGQTFLMSTGGQMVPVTVSTPVRSFVRDSLQAAAVGLRYGLPLETIARGIEAAGSVPQRVERLDRGQDVAVFLDAATSGHALATTLGSLRRLTPGRLVLLAAEEAAAAICGGARGGQAPSFLGRVGRWCDDTVLVPPTVVDEDCDAKALAAYARIDRLLSTLGGRDCVLVLDKLPVGGSGPVGPGERAPALAGLVDGWLELAHRPRAGLIGGPRRAA